MDVPLHRQWHDIHASGWLIVLTALVAAAMAYGASTRMTPVYEAKTTFYLAGNATSTGFLSPVPDQPQQPLFPLADEKLASLDLGILRGVEFMSRLAAETDMTRSDLDRQVDVTVNGEFMIDVFVRDPDPARASETANLVPGLYAGFHETSMRMRADAVAAAIRTRLDALREQRALAREDLQRERAASLSAADAQALTALQRDRDAATVDLAAADARVAQAEARRDVLARDLDKEGALYADRGTIETTTAYDFMLQRLLDLRVDLASVTDGPTGPRRRAIEDQVAAIDAAMEAERGRLAEAQAKPQGSLFEQLRLQLTLADADFAEAVAARDAADGRIAEAASRFDAVLAAVGRSDETNARLAGIDAQIAAATANLATAEMQALNATAPIVVVSRATPPERPAFPLPSVNAAIAGLCGLILGTYYALYMAHADRARRARASETAPLPLFTAEEVAALRRGAPLLLDRWMAAPGGRLHG